MRAKKPFLPLLVLIMVASSVLAVGVSAARPAPAAAACAIGQPNATYDGLVDDPLQARVWRLYQAAFLRQPDRRGFDQWTARLDGGMSLVEIANTFAGGIEFTSTYGRLDNRAFVRRVYVNVQCREPDRAGWDAWTTRLNKGLSRSEMLLQFSEGPEYLGATDTCYSSRLLDPSRVDHCERWLVPLNQARLGLDGYQAFGAEVPRAGTAATATFRGVLVDMNKAIKSGPNGILSTGHRRCVIASINGNWVDPARKDAPDPGALGIGVVDGAHVKGSMSRDDRGVLGVRTNTPSEFDHVLMGSGGRRLVLTQDFRPTASNGWEWAASGVTLAINGSIASPYIISPGVGAWFSDSYTHRTLNHAFVAFDRDRNRLLFGATSEMTSMDFVRWALNQGYEDVIKYDGGASTEYNIARQVVVAGTSRDLPVWVGVGCGT